MSLSSRYWSWEKSLKMSEVRDSRGRLIFSDQCLPGEDEVGMVVFVDPFPGEKFPHLCRYVFVKQNGTTAVAEATWDPPSTVSMTQWAGPSFID